MKTFDENEMKKIYDGRCEKIVKYLQDNEIGAAVFIDDEAERDASIRYFTGHSGDAVFIVFDTGKNVLIPWDEILAKKNAFAKKIIPLTKYKNRVQAVQANLNSAKSVKNQKVEISPETSYPKFLKFVDALSGWDVRCKDNGIHNEVKKMRMVKDDYEISCIKEAARISDVILAEIETKIKNGTIKTETDVALLIEKMARENGCEKTGFDTLAASSSRSWAIHAFPGYTANEWPGNGLAILDFGVVYNGYTSDVTLTVAKGELSPQQEKLITLVETAYNECLQLYKKGVSVKTAHEKADAIFATAKRKMPHTLGHAIGLEIHEYPRISVKMADDVVFAQGMVVTLEPGLYDEALGGVRLENDVLITENGNEVLTKSKILRI